MFILDDYAPATDANIALPSLDIIFLALVVVEDGLTHTHGLGRDLDEFVLLDVFETFLERHDSLGDDAGLLVGTRGTDVRELLGLADVDHEVVVMDMFANHLPGIDILTRIDEELSTILQLIDGIGKGITSIHGNHRTIDTTLYLTLERLILLEAVGHDGLTLRSCEDIGAQTDDTARGDVELDVDTLTLRLHRRHLTLTAGDHINHLRRELLRHVDSQFLDGFALYQLRIDN